MSVSFEFNLENRYVNITEICNPNGKTFEEWFILESSQKFMDAFVECMYQDLDDERNCKFRFRLISSLEQENESPSEEGNKAEPVRELGPEDTPYSVSLIKKHIRKIAFIKQSDREYSETIWGHHNIATMIACWISPTYAYGVVDKDREGFSG